MSIKSLLISKGANSGRGTEITCPSPQKCIDFLNFFYKSNATFFITDLIFKSSFWRNLQKLIKKRVTVKNLNYPKKKYN